MDEPDIPISDLRFLVVDDSPFIRRVMQEMLKGRLGARSVDVACDGAEALRILERLDQEMGETPNLGLCVFSDIHMPNINGLALLRAIRTGQAVVPRDTTVIMMTGSAGAFAAERAVELDASGFVAKPASHTALQGAIAKAFSTVFAPKANEVYAAVEVSR